MPDSEIAAVDLEIADLMVHRVEDDTWVWIGGADERVALSFTQTEAQAQVPLHRGTYDRVSIVVDAPRIATDGSWHAIALGSDELELAIDLELRDDARLEVVFDVDASLVLADGAWRFDPHVEVDAFAL
jgi:hypothetical protein